ncbi:hypothetical protein [Oceanobacillus senegalensis]|uniref:hypothetical protein n=1 Tax=Oceanobacillus senegalensis TaxID=1936063 RepID=UPI000A30CD5C|nr:hypothetical protein [Oceanobacillus senegalensis]
MNLNEEKWAAFILLILFISYILPYTVLSNVAKWYGSFLLWTFLTLIVIVINYILTKNWGKEE